MKTIVHVNQHHIRANRKDGGDRPPISVRTYKGLRTARQVELTGPAKIVYSPEKPLSCGARVWIETQSEVKVLS